MSGYSRIARALRYCERELQVVPPGPRRDHLLACAERNRAELAGRCTRCGRELSDADSIARGMGPECARSAS